MSNKPNIALPPGYQLQDYEIKKVLSSGGFSFVYLAHDKNNNIVAIKEYLPTTIALRNHGAKVLPKDENVALFKHGLKSFFDEGLSLANIEHKNIIRVLNFFRANETVYMVMQYERGKLLKDYLSKHPAPVSEPFIQRIFSELSNGLREVHAQKLLHLDIKPANIYIRLDGSPVLLDFGSARQALSDGMSKIAPSFTPGYASPEQHFDSKLLGPWSDIYSIGATMYACLMRIVPLAANMRIEKDTLTPATIIGKKRYSPELLEIIDNCLQLDHLARPQSVHALQKALLDIRPRTKIDSETKIAKGMLHKIVGSLNKERSVGGIVKGLNKPIALKKAS